MIARVMIVTAAAMLVTACNGGRSTTTLKGNIKYQGKPVVVGAIYFHAPDNQVAMGVIFEDGTYTATDVPVGPLRVSFQVKDPGLVSRKMDGANSTDPPPRMNGVTSLPPKFADPDQSGLVYTITSGTQTLDITFD